MEIGAVKQAFNNEVILMKKKLNQAKIQIIHKLTRKAKTFTEKKASDTLKEKLKRKAESAVKEVLIIKKIKAQELAKFIVTHTGELQQFLNKPEVDHDKACARLLLHKCMQEKYKLIRNKFTDIRINDLFMSRLERRKLKKEARESKKNKKKEKDDKKKAVNAEGDWDVEDVDMSNSKEIDSDDGSDISQGDENVGSDVENESEDDRENNEASDNDDREKEEGSDDDEEKEEGSDGDEENQDESDDDGDNKNNDYEAHNHYFDENESNDDETTTNVGKFVKSPKSGKNNAQVENIVKPNNNKKPAVNDKRVKQQHNEAVNKKGKKPKDINKNKNFNEKIALRKFKKDEDEAPVKETKMVDPFFITETGDNYLSVVEPRQPDEIKEIHRQGNRKLRRAAMFGHVPKIKPRQDNFRQNNYRQEDNSFRKNNFRQDKSKENGFASKNGPRDKFNKFDNSNDRKSDFKNFDSKRNDQADAKPEKLHPSWEAKKKQSGILPFQGKKIVFDES